MTAPRPAAGGRALVLQHEEATPAGRILDWLEDHHMAADVVRIDLTGGEADASGYDIVVPLGSEFAPYQDEIEWIPKEAELLREVHESGASVLGICFGGQLLARALGSRVYRARRAEIGWLPVHSKDPSFVSEGPWFQWHFDTFDAPPGSEVIADNDVGPQAYVVGRSMGLQFHPEVTPEIMDLWVKAYPHELVQEHVDPDDLLEETGAQAEHAAARARQLFDAFLARVVGRT